MTQRLIDADALERDGWRMHRIVRIDEKTMESQIRKLTDFPAVDAEPVKHGKWITKKNSGINCSVCGHSRWSQCYMTTVLGFNYCPNCGCRMDAE